MESSQKINMAFDLLRDAEEKIATARHLLQDPSMSTETLKAKRTTVDEGTDVSARNIVEGVFDGQSMIGSDKKIYPVPANYASKSKLVEGDTLKLTIVDDGSFIYKQIGPVERRCVRGVLERDERGDFCTRVGSNQYKVLFASVTYFKGVEGDEVTLVLPGTGKSTWAAIENVIKPSASGMPQLVRDSMDRLASGSKQPNTKNYDPAESRSIPVAHSEPDGNAQSK